MAIQPVSRLRFRAREGMVQDFEKLDVGIKRHLGWVMRQIAPPKTPTNPEDKGTWEIKMTDETVEVPNRAEYRRACQDGALWPADEATARECGVDFDPHFGSEPTYEPASDVSHADS